MKINSFQLESLLHRINEPLKIKDQVVEFEYTETAEGEYIFRCSREYVQDLKAMAGGEVFYFFEYTLEDGTEDYEAISISELTRIYPQFLVNGKPKTVHHYREVRVPVYGDDDILDFTTRIRMRQDAEMLYKLVTACDEQSSTVKYAESFQRRSISDYFDPNG